MDKIIYVLISNGGGIDGMDHTDKGGKEVYASFDKTDAQKHPNAPWCRVEALIVDTDKAYKEALAKLSAVDRLILKDLNKTFGNG